MPFPPYLASERLEDFRAEAASEGFYADAQEQRLRDIRAAIEACCDGRLSVSGALAILADQGAIETTGARAERIAWAREVIREAFTETILSVKDAKALRELGDH